MKHIVQSIIVTILLVNSLTANALTLPNYERNTTTLDKQKSPENFVYFEDAYVSYKYVGGLVLIMTFSVPALSYEKEFYLVTVPHDNKSVKSRFARSKSEFMYGTANTLWLGRSRDGRRDRFVMRVSGIFNPNGPYTMYAKMAGRNIRGQFTLKRLER